MPYFQSTSNEIPNNHVGYPPPVPPDREGETTINKPFFGGAAFLRLVISCRAPRRRHHSGGGGDPEIVHRFVPQHARGENRLLSRVKSDIAIFLFFFFCSRDENSQVHTVDVPPNSWRLTPRPSVRICTTGPVVDVVSKATGWLEYMDVRAYIT